MISPFLIDFLVKNDAREAEGSVDRCPTACNSHNPQRPQFERQEAESAHTSLIPSEISVLIWCSCRYRCTHAEEGGIVRDFTFVIFSWRNDPGRPGGDGPGAAGNGESSLRYPPDTVTVGIECAL